MYPTYFHLAAYFGSLTNGSTLAQVPAVSDQVLTRTTANNFVLPKKGKLWGIYSFGASITDAQLNTPSLRYVGLPFVGFLNTSLTVPSPPNLCWWGEMGPPIPEVDEIQMAHSLAGGAPENEGDLLWFGFGYKPPTPGPVYRLKFTSTITAAAGTWVSGALSPASTLPSGTYDVIGMDCVGANLVGARLIFPGSFFRPGVLCRNTVASIYSDYMVDYQLGTFGTFKSVNIPNLEILSSGANSAQTTFLDLVRVGDWQP